MNQQQKNSMVDQCLLFLADVYEVEKLKITETQEIGMELFGAEYCFPHPVQKDVFWPIGLIMMDLKKRRWRNKRVAKWLKSLVYDEKALVVAA
jgi:hypothetical protein